MLSERTKKNTIALSVTIIVNFVVCISVATKAYFALYFVGLGFAPIFGGIFRSLVAYKKDVIPIILITATIDIFALVPLINYVWDACTGAWTGEYLLGLLMGAITGVIMMITGFITLAIRHNIDRNKAETKQQDQIMNQKLEIKY